MNLQGRELLNYLLPHGHTGSEIGTDGVDYHLLLSLFLFDFLFYYYFLAVMPCLLLLFFMFSFSFTGFSTYTDWGRRGYDVRMKGKNRPA